MCAAYAELGIMGEAMNGIVFRSLIYRVPLARRDENGKGKIPTPNWVNFPYPLFGPPCVKRMVPNLLARAGKTFPYVMIHHL